MKKFTGMGNPTIQKFDANAVKTIAISTDGVSSFIKDKFQKMPMQNVLENYVNFKNFKGSFVKRRVKKATEELFAQEFENSYAINLNYFRGNVMAHSPDLHQLISGHPDGLLVSFSQKTNGDKEWHSLYNFPEYGAYFLFQDYKNKLLGYNYALGAFYNFYFSNRNLSFKMAQGIGITSNPYDKETNSKNKALGSKVMGNINLGLNYKKENVIDNFGFQAGFLFTHFSNGRIKSPNSGINTYCLNVGVNYVFDEVKIIQKD
jgi:hypothetical protein